MSRKPLEGIRVLALETQVAAPYCTMMLADAGAEVIKLEAPGRGDASREPGPQLWDEKHENRISGYFMRFNRNKKSLTLDMRSDDGKQTFTDLVKNVDVVIENMKPGFLKKLGFTWDKLKEINPRLVYVTISGFGTDPRYQGPYSDRPAYDIIIQAMAGMMNMIGEPGGRPIHPMIAFADVAPGMLTAYAIMLALFNRETTGLGDYIDMAMYDGLMALTERALNVYSMTGSIMERGKESLIHPWGSFKTKDGYVAMIVQEKKMWQRFCDAIGKPELFEDPRFATGEGRCAHRDELDPIINEWLSTRTSEEVVNHFLPFGLPCGIVNNAKQVFEDEHTKARKMFVTVNDPIAGEVKVVNTPIKMASLEVPEVAQTVPRLGEHTDSVLKAVAGYDDAKIADLRAKNVL